MSRKPKTYRAGKRKCKRCKVMWHRVKGESYYNCERCRVHCSRCDSKMKTKDAKQSQCGPCKVELATAALKTKDPTGYKRRDYMLNLNYGITAVEYDKILKDQNGGCWICGKVPAENQRRLSVDHLHSKGEKKRNPREKRGRVRGLLCWAHNGAIGKFKDNVSHLRKAADYLEVWPAQQVLKKEKPNE